MTRGVHAVEPSTHDPTNAPSTKVQIGIEAFLQGPFIVLGKKLLHLRSEYLVLLLTHIFPSTLSDDLCIHDYLPWSY